MSGHIWDDSGERCELCGDKDWYADPYCSNNPEVKMQYLEYVKSIVKDDRDSVNDTS